MKWQQGHAPPAGCSGEFFLPLPGFRWLPAILSSSLHHSNLCLHHCTAFHHVSLCLSVSPNLPPLIRTPIISSGAHPNPVWLPLNFITSTKTVFPNKDTTPGFVSTTYYKWQTLKFDLDWFRMWQSTLNRLREAKLLCCSVHCALSSSLLSLGSRSPHILKWFRGPCGKIRVVNGVHYFLRNSVRCNESSREKPQAQPTCPDTEMEQASKHAWRSSIEPMSK